MDFGEVLSKSWRIIWRNKILWLFGILASCGSGGNSGGSNSMRYGLNDNGGNYGTLPPEIQQFFFNIERFFEQNPWVIILIILALLLLFLLAIFITTIGRIALIRGASQADEGVKLSFGTLFNDSLRYFWRVFLLNLLSGIVIALAFIVLGLLAIAGTALTLGIGLICLIPLLCLVVPLMWLVNGVLMMASTAIVVEDVGIMDGLRRGWEVVTKNLGAIIVIALIIFIGGGIIGFIIALPFLAAFLPLIIGAVNNTWEGLRSGAIVTVLLSCILFPIMLALMGILTSYTSTLWTLTYRRLTGRRATGGSTLAPVVIDSPTSGATIYEAPENDTLTEVPPTGGGGDPVL